MLDGIDFKIIDGKVKIATEQVVDMEEFEKRISSIAAKKVNFNLQKEYFKNQIEEATKNIKLADHNIQAATEDLEEAYQFLRLNHREDVLTKIQAKIVESEKQAEAQLEAAKKQSPQ